MKDTILGLDLAKTIFHFVEINRAGKQLKKRKLRRRQMNAFFANHPECLIAMEACGSAHYWGRAFQKMGHEVILLPPQHVKGYLRGQKNDYNDALAIAESAQHGAIRPVAIRSIEQQDKQAFHRIRRQLISERTRLSNQVRGLLAEYGLVFRIGDKSFKENIPMILENANNELSARFRVLLNKQYRRFLSLEKEIQSYQEQLEIDVKQDEVCQRLIEIPAFGPVVSSAFNNWVGNGLQFKRGRDASAALGIVPRQHSTGGKSRLYGITKNGDSYVRTLIIHGSRSVTLHAKNKTDPLSCWINRLVERRGFNKAVVALANKLVRIAWVVVARHERYAPKVLQDLKDAA